MSFDFLAYIDNRMAEIWKEKKGQTYDTKLTLNYASWELHKIKEAALQHEANQQREQQNAKKSL